MVLDSAGVAPIRLTSQADVTPTRARWTRDGRWLLWGELSGHAMCLMRAPLGDPSRSERLPWPLAL